MIRHFGYILIFIILITQSKAQQPNIDSLQHEIQVAKNDTIKITLLLTLSQYYADTKPDSSVYFAEQRLSLTRKLNLKLEEVDASLYMGYGLVNLGNYPLALE